MDIWKKIKDAGFKAVALTTDTTVLGKRDLDVVNPFELPKGLNMSIYERYFPILGNLLGDSDLASSGTNSGLKEFTNRYKSEEVIWEEIPKLKQLIGLPLIAKGVACKEDALLAVKYGADAIIVSNHGSR